MLYDCTWFCLALDAIPKLNEKNLFNAYNNNIAKDRWIEWENIGKRKKKRKKIELSSRCVVGLFIFLSCTFIFIVFVVVFFSFVIFVWIFFLSIVFITVCYYCCRFVVNRPQIICNSNEKKNQLKQSSVRLSSSSLPQYFFFLSIFKYICRV